MNTSKAFVVFTLLIATTCEADGQEQAGAATSDSAATVHHRILSLTDNANIREVTGRTYLDIETGAFLPGQAREWQRLREQLRRAGVDIFISITDGSLRITAVDMRLAVIAGAKATVPLDKADFSVKSATAALLAGEQHAEQEVKRDHLYYFRTTEGSIGVLRLGAFVSTEPPAREIEYRILQPATWGKASNGLRVRLRPEISQWPQGQIPALTLDINNTGDKSIEYIGITPAECILIVDEKPYGWSKPLAVSAPGRSFAPGQKVIGAATIMPDGDWARPKEGAEAEPNSKPGVAEAWAEPLEWKLGAHSVQVRFNPSAPSKNYRALSNVVQLKILEPQGTVKAPEGSTEKPVPCE